MITSRDSYRICPHPTYRFEVGDLVAYGSIDRTEILKVVDDGKFYECKLNHMRRTNSTPVPEECFELLCWLELRPLLADPPASVAEDDDIRLNYSQRDVSGLLISWYHFGIDLDPAYQRGNVWALKDKVMLIDSIFHNVDIGKFVLVKKPWVDIDTPSYEMLDGKQRLTALTEFFENKFPYKGMLYNELNFSDKTHFRHYPVSWAELGENTSLEQKLRAFLKLNTAGHVVDPKHLDMVEELLMNEAKANG